MSNRVLYVSNFSTPGRGTYVISDILKTSEAIDFVPFDTEDRRGARGPMITVRAVRALLRALREHPDAAVMADTRQGLRLLAVVSALRPGRLYLARYGNVYSERAALTSESLVGRVKAGLYDRGLRAARRVIVPSQATRQSLVSHGIKAPAEVEVVPNGTHFDGRPPATFSASGPVRLRFVGRLDEWKAPGVAVEVLREVRQSHGLDARLDVYGRGEDRDAVLELVRRHGLGEHVALHGQVDDPWAGSLANTVLVHPARRDGFGFVVLEAVASGVPVVLFEGVGGPEEVVAATGGGVVVGERDPARMAAAVAALVADPAALTDRMRAARQDARTRYGADAMVRGYEDAIGRLLAEAAAEVRPRRCASSAIYLRRFDESVSGPASRFRHAVHAPSTAA